jgi:hypothetical protein
MTRSIRIDAEADDEISHAIDRYERERQREGLGSEELHEPQEEVSLQQDQTLHVASCRWRAKQPARDGGWNKSDSGWLASKRAVLPTRAAAT